MITQKLSSIFNDPDKTLDIAPMSLGIDLAPDYYWTAQSVSVNEVPVQSVSEIVSGGSHPFYATQPESGPGLVGAGDGLRGLDFDGVDDWLRGDELPITQGSIVIMCRVDPSYISDGVVQPFIMFNNQEQSVSTQDGLIWYSPNEGDVRLNPVGTGAGPAVSTRTYQPGEWLVICYSNPSGGETTDPPVRFMVNGEAINTLTDDRNFHGYNRLYLAHGGTPERRLHGQIAFLSTWHEQLTFSQMATVTRTLKDTYPSQLSSVSQIWGE